jgi:hypothetical protein
MPEKLNRLLGALLISLVLIGVVPATLNQIHAAPPASAVQVVNLNSTAVHTSTIWSGGRWSGQGQELPPSVAEIWLNVDEGTVNTATFALQVSPDNSTWLAHNTAGALATNLAADSNTYTRTTIEGVYYRIVATLTNTNTLTPVIKIVLR